MKFRILSRESAMRPAFGVVIPVRGRIIEAHLQAVLAACLHVGLHQIAPMHLLLGAELAEFAGPQRVAITMPCHQHRVLETRPRRRFHPTVGIIVLRIEAVSQRIVFLRWPVGVGGANILEHAPRNLDFSNAGRPPVHKQPQSPPVKPGRKRRVGWPGVQSPRPIEVCTHRQGQCGGSRDGLNEIPSVHRIDRNLL